MWYESHRKNIRAAWQKNKNNFIDPLEKFMSDIDYLLFNY